jgi:hypothetical protein
MPRRRPESNIRSIFTPPTAPTVLPWCFPLTHFYQKGSLLARMVDASGHLYISLEDGSISCMTPINQGSRRTHDEKSL